MKKYTIVGDIEFIDDWAILHKVEVQYTTPEERDELNNDYIVLDEFKGTIIYDGQPYE